MFVLLLVVVLVNLTAREFDFDSKLVATSVPPATSERNVGWDIDSWTKKMVFLTVLSCDKIVTWQPHKFLPRLTQKSA